MAFDGNGNWISNFSAESDRDAGYKILASRFDNIFIADIAQSFENCLTKDAQVKPIQPFDANNFRIINVANPSANTDAVNLATLNTKDGTAVHKTGTETISGNKTFSGANTFSGDNTFSGTNTFTKNIVGSITGNAGTVTNGVYTTGNQTIAGTKTFSSTISGSIDGNAATVTNGVYTTGNQTIDGTKTFSSDQYRLASGTSGRYNIKNTSLDLTNTSRTSDIYAGLRSYDKNDNIAGDLSFIFSTAGTSTAQLQARNRASGSQVTAAISVNIANDGSIYTAAPTPTSATDNTTKIATTAWVNSHLSNATVKSTITGYCVPNYASAVTITSPYTPAKNGIIIAKAVGGNCTCDISKGSLVISRNQSGDTSSTTNAVWAIVKSGEQYTISTYGTATLTFVPFVGG